MKFRMVATGFLFLASVLITAPGCFDRAHAGGCNNDEDLQAADYYYDQAICEDGRAACADGEPLCNYVTSLPDGKKKVTQGCDRKECIQCNTQEMICMTYGDERQGGDPWLKCVDQKEDCWTLMGIDPGF